MVTELVAFVVQNLVSEPERLEITTREGAQGLFIEIRCAPEDAGRIIGRGGRTINSIRTLARAASEGQERVEVQLSNP
ncbi:MAG: KH domain RNA binding protein YlqC [uncultured Truepera sp.]|uniref:RNA-binding protein KhpA n=1 Tax=uncultured Truepera sp. TaxID=543023 RepID=A0A6J4VEU6_9DEIN|nr:MAG: KH domain RNA binding protein YlqC [uncultured Truepera sp.]